MDEPRGVTRGTSKTVKSSRKINAAVTEISQNKHTERQIFKVVSLKQFLKRG